MGEVPEGYQEQKRERYRREFAAARHEADELERVVRFWDTATPAEVAKAYRDETEREEREERENGGARREAREAEAGHLAAIDAASRRGKAILSPSSATTWALVSATLAGVLAAAVSGSWARGEFGDLVGLVVACGLAALAVLGTISAGLALFVVDPTLEPDRVREFFAKSREVRRTYIRD